MRRSGGPVTTHSGRGRVSSVNSTSTNPSTLASALANVEGALTASNQRVAELEAESASYRSVLDSARQQLQAAAAHAASAGESVTLRVALDIEYERVKKLELALIEAREEVNKGTDTTDNVDGATARVLRAAVSAAEEAVIEATRRADDAERRTQAALILAETRGRALLASVGVQVDTFRRSPFWGTIGVIEGGGALLSTALPTAGDASTASLAFSIDSFGRVQINARGGGGADAARRSSNSAWVSARQGANHSGGDLRVRGFLSVM